MASVQLSALLVVHNEEEVLEEALKSVHFCDEIVVVLDRCSDASKKIAAQYTDKLIEGAWELEGPRRNTGIEACSGAWILEVDADERVAPPLAHEIREFIQTAGDGYVLLPVQNYVGKRLVAHGWAGSFGTTKAKKLFKKGCKVWGDQRVHPKLVLKGAEYEIGTNLKGGEGLIHLVDKNINDMVLRMLRYSDAMAADMVATGKYMPFCKALRKGGTRFYKSFIARKGYKEGRYGFLLATMAALTIILAQLKATLEHEQ